MTAATKSQNVQSDNVAIVAATGRQIPAACQAESVGHLPLYPPQRAMILRVSAGHAGQIAGEEEITNPIVSAWKMHNRERVPVIEIAKRFGVSRQTIYNWLAKMEKTIASSGEAGERARDLAAIDEWIADLRAGVDAGEIDLGTAAARVLPFFVRRAQIIGYDAPRKSAITIQPERKEAKPDMALLEELRKFAEHEERMAEHEAADGLDEMGIHS